jgi:putative SOS response-associated peptidase YedK
MCGRFSRTSGREVLAEEFGVVRFADVDLRPRYNIAPSQTVEAILRDGVEKRLELMRWGFTPSFAKEPKLTPINARAETVATSPMFRDAFRRRRCLIVADGFYEWRKDERRKTPHFIHLRSGRPFGFAGIWSSYAAAVGTPVATGAILTCPPNELMVPIHNRMPVILPAAGRDRWLDPSAGEDDLRALLVPLPSEELEAYEVSTFVNSPRNDAPECVRRVLSCATRNLADC